MIRLPAERARDTLLRAMEPFAAPFTTITATSQDWASGLFYGARHRLALRIEGGDAAIRAAQLQAALPEMELAMAQGFVADLHVVRLDENGPILAIEALTIDDPEQANRVAHVARTGAVNRAGRPAC
ncbi:hypothetical protein [Sphingomonas abietis]|uniref:Uncharacterized protein n=1 Tax=Sphingomonas abietis TaxID=3012344 RepID=A0ABY7NRQ1_9SPHN|nr:hypothetical protein [Sphingomonas abietis]WBO22176.1 hypothetical protein PBT88_18810 [Sphingomonas abietis]